VTKPGSIASTVMALWERIAPTAQRRQFGEKLRGLSLSLTRDASQWRAKFSRLLAQTPYDYDSRREPYEVPPLVIPFRPGESLLIPRTPEIVLAMSKSSLDRVNATARKASFADELAAERWARKQLAKHSEYSWGFVVQTRDEGARPWYVRFMDK
jgi:hypothetical protein